MQQSSLPVRVSFLISPPTSVMSLHSTSRFLARSYLLVLLAAGALFLSAREARAQETILGEELVEPGISIVFEGAVKDAVTPSHQHLPENQTDVHLEARINWSTDPEVEVPDGAPRGGFVPYLNVFARIENESSGAVEHVSLVSHVNLIDNFHYARNVALPGSGEEDTYQVTFYVHPPDAHELSFHRDWNQAHGSPLFAPHTFEYTEVDFSDIVGRRRR